MNVLPKARQYIDTVLEAHDRAGLVLERKHFFMLRDILCGVESAIPAASLALDTTLATEPAPVAAKRLLKTSSTQ